jgi:hypothetical protein
MVARRVAPKKFGGLVCVLGTSVCVVSPFSRYRYTATHLLCMQPRAEAFIGVIMGPPKSFRIFVTHNPRRTQIYLAHLASLDRYVTTEPTGCPKSYRVFTMGSQYGRAHKLICVEPCH